MSERLAHPRDHPELYGMTVVFSAFLWLGYLLLRTMMQVRGVVEVGRRRGS